MSTRRRSHRRVADRVTGETAAGDDREVERQLGRGHGQAGPEPGAAQRRHDDAEEEEAVREADTEEVRPPEPRANGGRQGAAEAVDGPPRERGHGAGQERGRPEPPAVVAGRRLPREADAERARDRREQVVGQQRRGLGEAHVGSVLRPAGVGTQLQDDRA